MKRKTSGLDLKTLATTSHQQEGWSERTLATPPATCPTDQQEWSEGYPNKNIRYANAALDYYNNKNHTKFELVEDQTMESNPFYDHNGVRIHCSFHAKDSSIKQLFADIHMNHNAELVVTTCEILKEKNHVGCVYCDLVIHPVDGYSPRNLEKDIDFENKTPATTTRQQEGWSERTPVTPPTHQQEDLSEGTTATPTSEYEDWKDGILFTPRATSPIDQQKMSEWCHEENIRYANVALDYYNKKNHAKFELVEDQTMESNLFFNHNGQWIHCSFHAKDSSIEQFFAEIQMNRFAKLTVITCEILKEKTRVGCVYCDLVIHPVDGYQAGLPIYSPRGSRLIYGYDERSLGGS